MREHTVLLFGGLGNQLFQYAFGRHLAATSGREVGYVRAGDASVDDLRSLTGIQVRDSRRGLTPLGRLSWLHSLATRAGGRGVHVDLSMSPWAAPEAMQRASVWCGYWQHPDYVSTDPGVLAQVRGSLSSFRQDLDPSRPAVALHVRRGDYVGQVPSLSPDYYVRAFGTVCDGLGVSPHEAAAVLVSDDPAWATAHLGLPTPYIVSRPGTVLQDLATLSAADGIVMSQSTFSWWAARASGGAVVAAPEPWRLSQDAATDDGAILRLPHWSAVQAGYG